MSEKAEIPMITYWCGVDIRKLSREDLEKAFVDLGRLYKETSDRHFETLQLIFKRHPR